MSWIYTEEYNRKRNGAGTGYGDGVGLGCGYQAGNIIDATISVCRTFSDGTGTGCTNDIFKDSRLNNLKINKRLYRKYSYIIYDDIVLELKIERAHD